MDELEPEEEEEKVELSQQEWDERIKEAVLRALYEIVESTDLPLEPSDFLKMMMEFSLDDGTKIDLKKTSFKKIGKLLEIISTGKNGLGYIEYLENKQKGHKVIAGVNKDTFKDFVPKYKLKRVKANKAAPEESKVQSSSVNYPKVQIDEVFLLGKHFDALNRALKEPLKLPFYNMKDVKELIAQYIKENGLEESAKRGHITLDPFIGKLVGDIKPGQTEVKKEYVFKNIITNLQNCYTVTLIDQQQLVHEKEKQKMFKGDVPTVEILAQKTMNKKQTTITGLELYMIDYDELCSYLQHKCASSVAIAEIEHLSTVKN